MAFTFYPKYGDGTWLYALGYKDGRTKIGISNRPRSRLTQHWVACDGSIDWVHLFAPLPRSQCEWAERDALRRASEVGSRIRRTEVFRNLSREATLRCVREAVDAARA